MPEETYNYQCPNCGGPLKWDGQTQKLHCDYCGSSFTAAEVETFYKEKEEAACNAVGFDDLSQQWSEEEASHMKAYSCTSCGAQLIADENTAVTTCPYCGNPVVIASQFKSKRPQYVLPFAITKQQAEQCLSDFYKKKPFLPHAFSSENHIHDVKGVYVPYWLFDASVKADMIYSGELVRSYQSGDNLVTETSHYRLLRKGTVEYKRVPSDASSKMPDEYMDALEPYDYQKLESFNSAYMAGYMADSYDVSAEEKQKQADERMRATTISVIRSTLGPYANTLPIRQDITRISGSAVYVFLPVWLLSTDYRGTSYLFAVNGETGKTVGNLPVDYASFARQTILMAVVIFAVIAVMLWFLIV